MSNEIILSKSPESYWLNIKPKTEYPKLTNDTTVEVAIVGGGIAGILTAYQLNKHGAKVAIFEANHILHGTTGHTTAKITSQHGLIYKKLKGNMSEELAKQYADANETAIQMIEDLVMEHGIDCDFIRQSAYIYTLQDDYIEKIHDEADVASSLGIKATYLEQIPLSFLVKSAVRFENQAQFHPFKFLIALAEEFTKHDGQIFEQSRIVNLENHDSTYTLITNGGMKIKANKVVIASHYPFYNKHGLYFTRLYPIRSYVVAAKIKENYAGGMYITAEEPGKSLRSQRTDQATLILISGEHHKTGQNEDTTKHYETLIDFARKIYTVDNIPYHWSTQDCMTLDDIPYVGHFTSDTPNLYIATGFGKWGMTNSMASSRILCDLILSGHSPWEEVYNPSRNNILASTKNFVVENLLVAKELIKGKFSPLPAHEEIKPGEGKIIEDSGQRLGAYRNEEGMLFVVNTTCPHMGCELNWNSAEKTWDCPCHGSRFSYKGEIIEGPAVKPLDKDNDVNTIEKLMKDEF